MSEHSKTYTDKAEYRNAFHSFTDYQKRHNIIRKDFELLLDITEKNRKDSEKFNTLYRACLKGILSLIESDIFGLNQLDKYDGYNDNHCFDDKFKKTFKQICKTWDKKEIIQLYLDTKYGELKKIKTKRDKLIHPKTTMDIPSASDSEFMEMKNNFYAYTKMLHSLMNDFFIGIQVKDANEFIEIIKK